MAHKTSAMVEAGIMAAIAIVFALINMYVPFVGMFLNFIWPLPIILCGMRHGMRQRGHTALHGNGVTRGSNGVRSCNQTFGDLHMSEIS